MNGFKEVSPKREMAKGWTVDKQRHEKYVYERGGNEFKRKSSNTRSEWKMKTKTKREAKKPTKNNESVFQRDLCERVEMLTFRSQPHWNDFFFMIHKFSLRPAHFWKENEPARLFVTDCGWTIQRKVDGEMQRTFPNVAGWTNVC